MADEIQDGSLCLSLSFSISETKHVIKKLTAHVMVTLEIRINKPIKNISVSFKKDFHNLI